MSSFLETQVLWEEKYVLFEYASAAVNAIEPNYAPYRKSRLLLKILK